MSEYKYEVDLQSRVVEARREGERRGERRGERKGELKGERKKAIEVARALKEMGDPIEKIARASGLSPDEIAAL
jgi:predicted transposase/invertase (TIGR01784 family)